MAFEVHIGMASVHYLCPGWQGGHVCSLRTFNPFKCGVEPVSTANKSPPHQPQPITSATSTPHKPRSVL